MSTVKDTHFRLESVCSNMNNNSLLRMYYWRGQSLKLHWECVLSFLGSEQTRQILRSLIPTLPPVNGHHTKVVGAHLCCLGDCTSSSRICYDYIEMFLLLGFNNFFSPQWCMSCLGENRAVKTKYYKCYNYSWMSLFPCVFCDACQYSKLHCCIFVSYDNQQFFFFKQKIFLFYPVQNLIQVVICFLCSL